MKEKINELAEMNKQIDLSVVELDKKLADVKMNLEIIELNKQTESLGLTVPEDVIASVGHTSVNVDTIVTKIDVLLGGKNAASVTSADVSAYIEALKA
ncbi:e.6 [Escherichia phage RB43]|uniref:E.6 n=1 Tax=Escherichia phage RB43 TaxID=2887182 RepID=Q56BD3_9CAUD|nr:e.6 [Escherichia phage RB43]AAX78788.1 e.6 [Escherichia phage RB43]